MSSFTKKILAIEIQTENEISRLYRGAPCNVIVTKAGGASGNTAKVTMFGLSYENMLTLTELVGIGDEKKRAVLTIRAGSERGQLAVAFIGDIESCSADFSQAPNVACIINARTGAFAQKIAASDLSVKGEAQAGKILEQLAGECGYISSCHVSSSVRNAYFSGSPIKKAVDLARQIGAELVIDDGEMLLLLPQTPRDGQAELLGKDTGLLGYPTFRDDSFHCNSVYNPNLRYLGLVEVRSIVPRASGIWMITKLTHKLNTALGSGKNDWISELECQNVN